MSLEHLVIDNIRRIRKEKGITQEKLAEYCGTSASYIGLMETYKNVPKLSTIERIAEALNVPVQVMFAETAVDCTEDEVRVSAIRNRIKQEVIQNLELCLDDALKVL